MIDPRDTDLHPDTTEPPVITAGVDTQDDRLVFLSDEVMPVIIEGMGRVSI